MLVSVAHAVLACLPSATLGELQVYARLLLPTEGTLLMIRCMPGGWIGSADPEQRAHSHAAQCVQSHIAAAVFQGGAADDALQGMGPCPRGAQIKLCSDMLESTSLGRVPDIRCKLAVSLNS